MCNDDVKEKDGEYYCEDDLPRKKEKKKPRKVTDIQGVLVKQVKEIIREIKKSEEIYSIRVEDDNIFITPKKRNAEEISVFLPNNELREPYTGDDYEKTDMVFNGVTKVHKEGYGFGAIDENGKIIVPIRYHAMNITTKYIAVRYSTNYNEGQIFNGYKYDYDTTFDFTGKQECPLIISNSGYFGFMDVYNIAKTK